MLAFGMEERLHRAIIDIALANCVARQFWNALNDASSFMLILAPEIETSRKRSLRSLRIIRRIPLQSASILAHHSPASTQPAWEAGLSVSALSSFTSYSLLPTYCTVGARGCLALHSKNKTAAAR